MGQDTDHAQSVWMWIQLYASPQEAPATILETVRCVLELAFPSAFSSACEQQTQVDTSTSDWGVVVRVLESFYEVRSAALGRLITLQKTLKSRLAAHWQRPLEINKQNLLLQQTEDLEQIMQLTLVAAVQSEKKETFVRDILMLPDAAQVDLMAIIEAGMSSSNDIGAPSPQDINSKAKEAEKSDVGGSMTDHEAKGQARSNSPSFERLRSPLHLSRNAELERTKRENEVLKHDNMHLARDLQDAMEQVKQAENTRLMIEEEIHRLQMQTEADTLKQERVIRSLFDQKLQVLQRDLDAANEELYQHRSIEKEARRLRDEVDLLSPTVKKVTKLEAALAKYKAKVEELPTLKEKLKRVEEMNGDLVAKNLSLETKVAKAAYLQRKLAEAKEVNTAVEFCVSELKTQVFRQTSELDRLRTDLEIAQVSLEEAKILNDQLQESVKQHGAKLTSVECSHSAASGIGDLNPELTQQLARLEHENQELRKQVDDETSERISSLVDEVEDMKRLKCSFETKYFDIEQQLKASADELDHARKIICDKDEILEINETEKKQLLATRATLESELKDANDKTTELSTEIENLKDEVEERIQREQISNDRVNHLENTARTQLSAIGSLQINLRVLREHKWMMQEDILGYSAEKATVVDERYQLREQMAELHCIHEETKKQLGQMFQQCQKLENQVIDQANSIKSIRSMFDNERELNTINSKTTKEILRQKHDRHIEELKRSDQEHDRMVLKAKEEYDQKILDYENRIREMENTQSACIARMTDTVDMKSSMIEKLKEELQQSFDRHIKEVEALQTDYSKQQKDITNEMQAARSELANYIEMHSVSDADWAAKERIMRELAETQIQQLQTSNSSLRSAFEQQKNELHQRIETQLNANSLMKKSKQALETELMNARAKISQLEYSVTRLESKAMLFEKERAHFSSEEEKKRDAEDEHSALSSRVNAQAALVVAELEKLHEDHKALQQERRNCQCDCSNVIRPSSLGEAKNDGQQFYSSQVRQLEYAKQQEEAKRRELMLVNSKLLQEQKQMQIKNNTLSNKTQQLKDKINGSLLRDERRKKELNQLRQEIASLRATASLLNTKEDIQVDASLATVDRASLPSDKASSATESEVGKDMFTPNKKRKKQHEVQTTVNTKSAQGHPPEASVSLVKRRMPLIYRNKSQAEKEGSSSECKQQ